MQTLATGGAGSIGDHPAERFVRDDHGVTVFESQVRDEPSVLAA